MSPDSRRLARRQAVFMLYQHDVTGLPITEVQQNAERERGRPIDAYTREVVAGVMDNRGLVDVAIDRAARGWDLERIAPLERNILRVAVHELISRQDIPTAVAIDEAVEMSKRYCQAEATGFVNGILGTVASEVRSEAP